MNERQAVLCLQALTSLSSSPVSEEDADEKVKEEEGHSDPVLFSP